MAEKEIQNACLPERDRKKEAANAIRPAIHHGAKKDDIMESSRMIMYSITYFFNVSVEMI
jgi:hypothetical protein